MNPPSSKPHTRNVELRNWQAFTVSLMVVGYSGYYLCRSTFSVGLPLIVEELSRSGWTADEAKIQLGDVASIGVLAYALGKFLSGGLADFIGGRRNFLLGMGGSIGFTLLFASGQGLPLFTLAWIGNRLVQSAGWVGVVKITSRWFSHRDYGTAMGWISLSYLFGDAAARAFLAWLLAYGFGWRAVFGIAAGVLSIIGALTFFFLHETPSDVGLPEPGANPTNLFNEEDAAGQEQSLQALLAPMLRSPAFLFVCILSLGFTLVRETFNTWTPTYFTEALGLSQAAAASQSAWFPFFGGISVLLSGYASDRLGQGGRAGIILVGLLASTAILLLLALVDFADSVRIPVWLISAVAFMMIGPYSYLGGAIALDFGGKRGSATACGIIDGVGYLGGMLAGNGIARATVHYGWSGAFLILAGVAAASAVFALLFLVNQRQTASCES